MFGNAHVLGRSSVRRKARRRSQHGFTLIEMLIVITIIFILMAVAIPRYERSVTSAREASLRQDLFVLRQQIEQYTLDKQAAPQSLDDLVTAHYMRELPADPITRQKDWRTVTDEMMLSPEQTTTGISDVFSNSDAVSPTTNTPYSTW
jgi:general secretion pathway protein G